MKITLLGTGTSQGIPVIGCECKVCQSANPKDKRFRSSIMIEANNENFVIDTGPDFRQQMLTHKVKKLSAVLYTHEHKDHTAGMDDVRSFNFLQKKPMDVYAEKRVGDALIREFSYVFSDSPYPGIPQINVHNIVNEAFSIAGVEFVPIRVMHHKLPVLGFRVGNVAYITDVKTIPEDEIDKLQNLDILIITALRKEEHISHMCLKEALEVIEKLKPKTSYLTHISHAMGLHNEVSKELPTNVFLGYDGLILEN